jgi:hypothetical protein
MMGGMMGGMGGGGMQFGGGGGDMMGGMSGGMSGGGQMGGMGGGQMGGGGGMGMMGGVTPNPLYEDLLRKIGRGYSVVEYYGGSYLISNQIVKDERDRVKPRETAAKAFPWCRDYPGLVDILAEVLDPDQRGAVVLEWNFDLNALQNITNVPRSDSKPGDNLAPPDVLYDETKIPLLVNQENPDIPRRYTFADYYGWTLGPEEGFREGELPNHLGAFDSPYLQISASIPTGQ